MHVAAAFRAKCKKHTVRSSALSRLNFDSRRLRIYISFKFLIPLHLLLHIYLSSFIFPQILLFKLRYSQSSGAIVESLLRNNLAFIWFNGLWKFTILRCYPLAKPFTVQSIMINKQERLNIVEWEENEDVS